MPRQLYFKENIYLASKSIIESQGIENLTIKEIAKKMKCSSQPIYHSYNSITDIKAEYISEYIKTFLDEMNENSINIKSLASFIINKCINNPITFKSIFFLSKEYSIETNKVVDNIRNITFKLNLDKIDNMNFLKEKNNDFSIILFSLCSAICLGYFDKLNESLTNFLVEKYLLPIFD
jgi:AcrR family transcriptional regulator